MTTIQLIAAMGKKNEIGNNNQLLFRLPIDLQNFKNLTWGTAVLMGRKTFDSLNQKPLSGRLNIVMSRQLNTNNSASDIIFVNTIDQVFDVIKKNNYKILNVIGGGMIYEMFLPLADTLILTRINKEFEADAFFPSVNFSNWKLQSTTNFLQDEKHKFAFDIQVWKKNNQ